MVVVYRSITRRRNETKDSDPQRELARTTLASINKIPPAKNLPAVTYNFEVKFEVMPAIAKILGAQVDQVEEVYDHFSEKFKGLNVFHFLTQFETKGVFLPTFNIYIDRSKTLMKPVSFDVDVMPTFYHEWHTFIDKAGMRPVDEIAEHIASGQLGQKQKAIAQGLLDMGRFSCSLEGIWTLSRGKDIVLNNIKFPGLEFFNYLVNLSTVGVDVSAPFVRLPEKIHQEILEGNLKYYCYDESDFDLEEYKKNASIKKNHYQMGFVNDFSEPQDATSSHILKNDYIEGCFSISPVKPFDSLDFASELDNNIESLMPSLNKKKAA